MNISKYIILGAIATFIFSCKNPDNKSNVLKQEANITDFAAHLVTEDTMSVRNLVTQFMGYAKEQKYEMAAAMLYKPHPENPWKEPQLLDNDELHQISKLLKILPITDYKIEYMKFYSAINNDVECTITVRNQNSSSTITHKLHFNPMNYLGGWRLCLKN